MARVRPGLTVPGAEKVQAQMHSHMHTHTPSCRRHTCTHTQVHTHTGMYEVAPSTSHTGPTAPTCRSFSFCFWKASTVSSSCWVVWLASTEALCTLVSACPGDRKCQECIHSGSFSVSLPCLWASSPYSWVSFANLVIKGMANWTMAKGAGAA